MIAFTRRAISVSALSFVFVACAGQDADPTCHEHPSGGGGTLAPAASGGGEGGSAVCIRLLRPTALRRVRVTDSRLLEPNTIVMAASQDPQTLWLPDARENPGAIVVVKEARNAERRVSVLVLERDEEIEYADSAPRSSRTFAVVDDDSCVRTWALLDPSE